MSVVAGRIAREQGVVNMTINTVPHDFGYSARRPVPGIPGVIVRIGEALERWGRRAGQPPTREQLRQLQAVRREAQAACADRGASAVYRLG
jgi:hypothetical protein